MKSIRQAGVALIAMAMLAGCGDGPEEPVAEATQSLATKTCEDLRADVISIAATNGVTIVKIYDPKTVTAGPEGASCTGRVLTSTGQEGEITYRHFKDSDGDWMVAYSDKEAS